MTVISCPVLGKLCPYILLIYSLLITVDSHAQMSRSEMRKECYQVVNSLSTVVMKAPYILDSKVTSTESRTSSIDRSILEDSTLSARDKFYMQDQAAHPKLKKWSKRKIHEATVVRDKKLKKFFIKSDNGWAAFQKKYGANGFYFFSIPLFTKDRMRSAIYVAYECAGVCGEGYIYILDRKGAEWVLTGQHLIWKSSFINSD